MDVWMQYLVAVMSTISATALTGLALVGWRVYRMTCKNHAVLTGDQTRPGLLSRFRALERFIADELGFVSDVDSDSQGVGES